MYYEKAIAAIFSLCCFLVRYDAGPYPQRVSEKEDWEKRHAGLLENSTVTPMRHVFMNRERKWDMVITAGFGFSTWLSHSGSSASSPIRVYPESRSAYKHVYENGWTLGSGRVIFTSASSTMSTALEQGLGCRARLSRDISGYTYGAGFRVRVYQESGLIRFWSVRTYHAESTER